MGTSQLWRLFTLPIQRMTVRSVGNVARAPNVQQSHIYNTTYTEPELIKYFTDNVVYKSGHYIVTSVPQGIQFSKEMQWKDSEKDYVSSTTLQDVIPTLCQIFNSEHLFVSKYPKRNSSGLLILSKNNRAFQFLRNHFETAQGNLNKIFTYLAVVIGSPSEKFNKVFKVQKFKYGSNDLCTLVLDDSEEKSRKMKKTSYEHRVIDSVNEMSLVKITVSYDLKDCVRYILAQKCFTPVFGDSSNVKRPVDFLFGAPLVSDPEIMKPKSYELDPQIMEKLQLNASELNVIPIHSHLYGLKLSMKNNSEFFVSVPPPESFVWTCKQLGLNRIEQFEKCPPDNQLT